MSAARADHLASRRSADRLSARRGRRAGALVASALLVALGPLEVGADHESAAAERAARSIQAAQDRANAAAQALFDAEARIDELEVEIAATEAKIADREAEVAVMRDVLAERAVDRFTQSATDGNPLFTPVDEMNNAAAANVYASAATGTIVTSIDDFTAAIEDLDDLADSLDGQRQEAEAARREFAAAEEAAIVEIARLQELQEQLLADAAVQHELEALRRQRAEQEAAEAARIAAEQQAAESRRPATAELQTTPPTNPPAPPASDAGDGGDDDGNDAGSDQPATTTAPPATTKPPAPPPPPPPPPPPKPTSNIVCPVAGPTAYADTWGAYRSGGRSHQGVDMISPAGTPLVAVEAGVASFRVTNLGGNSVSLAGKSGTRYFYAHLSSWEGSSRSVSQGEVIGYVGSTGNTNVNHLHFEVHPGGGVAVNPYPYVRAVC